MSLHTIYKLESTGVTVAKDYHKLDVAICITITKPFLYLTKTFEIKMLVNKINDYM